METESNLGGAGVEARGAMCVECLAALTENAGLLDRCGAALCRACAAEFYAPCAGCGGLIPRDEALERTADKAGVCVECHARGGTPGGDELPSDEEVASLVAQYAALHEESKRLEARMGAIKERLKLSARARPRVSNAVVLRAGDTGPAVRCSFTIKTTYDAARLSEVESLLGADEFAALFERKVSYSAVRDGLEAFLSSADEARATARELIRAAEQRAETATLNVVALKKPAR
jgi:hypothetical protein